MRGNSGLPRSKMGLRGTMRSQYSRRTIAPLLRYSRLKALVAVICGLVVAGCAYHYDRPIYDDDFRSGYGSVKDDPPPRSRPRRSYSEQREPQRTRASRAQSETRAQTRQRSKRLAAVRPGATPARRTRPQPGPAVDRPGRSGDTANRTPAAPRPPADSGVSRYAPSRPLASSDTGRPAATDSPAQPAMTTPARRPQPAGDGADAINCPRGVRGCTGELARLLAASNLAWVSAPATAADYVSGARLVAFGRLKDRLTCAQIATGLDESQTGLVALGAAIRDEQSLGRPTENLAATRAIALRVNTALTAEQAQRCK